MCEASRRRRSRRDRRDSPRDREALRDESPEVIGGPHLCFSIFGEEKRFPCGTRTKAVGIWTPLPGDLCPPVRGHALLTRRLIVSPRERRTSKRFDRLVLLVSARRPR